VLVVIELVSWDLPKKKTENKTVTIGYTGWMGTYVRMCK